MEIPSDTSPSSSMIVFLLYYLCCVYLQFVSFCQVSVKKCPIGKTEVCMKCLSVEHPSDSVGFYWISCSLCGNWYHNFSCVSAAPDSEFSCGQCGIHQVYACLPDVSNQKKSPPLLMPVTDLPSLNDQTAVKPQSQINQNLLKQRALASYQEHMAATVPYGFSFRFNVYCIFSRNFFALKETDISYLQNV